MHGENACCKNGKSLDWAFLILRLSMGIIFVLHGYGKLFGDAPGMTAFTGMVAGLGFPAPALFAYLAALSEFLGGIALILGVGTKYAAIAIGIVMLVAFAMVKKASFPKADVDFALLAMSIAIYLAGPGAFTIRKWMKAESKKESCKDCACEGESHKH